MRRTLAILLAVVSLAALAGAQGAALSQADIEKLLTSGVSPLRVAVLVEQQGLDFDPDSAYIRSLELRSDTEKLIEAVRAAGVKRIRPRAEASLKAQRWAQAEQDYRALLELEPNDAGARAGLGTALVQQGRADAAIPEFGRALAADPNNAAAHRGMGQAMAQRKDYAGALAELSKARALAPNDALTHAALGDVMVEQGDPDGAMAEYGQALKLDPSLQAPRIGMARAFERKGDLAGAESSYRALLAQDPKDARVNHGLGRVMEKKGSNQEALGFYRAAYTSEPGNATYRESYEKMVAITVNVNANINVNVNQPPQPAGNGLVHIYRKSRFVGSLGTWNVTVDGRAVAKLGNGRTFTVKLAAGKQHIISSEMGRNPLILEVEANKEYFVESFFVNEFFSGYVAIKSMPASQGRAEASRCRPIEPDRIYDRELVVGAGIGAGSGTR